MKQDSEGDDEVLGYTVKRAMALLHIGKTKMFELLKDKKIRTVKIGSKHFIPRTELELFLERFLTPPEMRHEQLLSLRLRLGSSWTR